MTKSIALLLHESSTLFRREFERAARPHKLTLMQWRVLGQLAKQDCARQNALGAAINASPMTVSDVADRLEAAGLIRRDADPEDSRAKLMTLTSEGQRLVEVMRSIAAEVIERACAGVDPGEMEIVNRVLARIVDNLEDK